MGIIVNDMVLAKKLYSDILELEFSHEEKYQDEVNIAFYPVGESQIELIADIHEGGPVNEIIADKGEGIHHIALEVENIYIAVDELISKGVPMRDKAPKAGAHGSMVAFLDPSYTHGVLIEIVQLGCNES